MLKKLIEKLQSMERELNQFDPSKFKDPLATQIEWSPIKKGGANFGTHKLIETDTNRLEFKASLGAKIFYSIFTIMGMFFAIIFPILMLNTEGESMGFGIIMPVLMGLVFTFVGIYLFYHGIQPIVFDKYKGIFYKGWKTQESINYNISSENFVRLDNIHAIQLISEYCRGNKSSYYSHELNLVLKDGKRINVIDHGNLNKIREDAKKLSEFLCTPVWDAT